MPSLKELEVGNLQGPSGQGWIIQFYDVGIRFQVVVRLEATFNATFQPTSLRDPKVQPIVGTYDVRSVEATVVGFASEKDYDDFLHFYPDEVREARAGNRSVREVAFGLLEQKMKKDKIMMQANVSRATTYYSVEVD